MKYATMQVKTSKTAEIRIKNPSGITGVENCMDRKDLFRPYDGDEGYIFVSYNHDNSNKVYEIITAFHEKGYRIWHDDGIPLGENFLDELAKRVKKCNVFFCFLSPEYIESQYCLRELSFAVNNRRTIIPIMLKDFELPDSIDFQVGMINRTYLSWFKSTGEFTEKMAVTAAKFLDPCKEGYIPPPPPQKPKWVKLVIPAAVLLVVAAVAAILLLRKPPEEGGQHPVPGETNVVSTVTETGPEIPEETEAGLQTSEVIALETEAAPTATEPAPTATATAPAITETPRPTVKPDALSASAQETIRYLSGRAASGCPFSVYDREGTDEADNVYDNAVAALALLSDFEKHQNHSDADLRKILDSLAERAGDDSVFAPEIGTRSLAAAALALLRYDRVKTSVAYVRAAQKILDRILETGKNSAGGFNCSETNLRSTEDNLWLYAAFSMLSARTGNSVYAEAAGSAKEYALSMLPDGASFFLAGDDAGDLLSVRTQAVAALVLQNDAGISAAAGLRRSGGYPPDDRSGEGICTEDTLLMALALRASGREEEAAQALAAVFSCLNGNGSIPETDAASLADGRGKTLLHAAKTSSAGWYAMAAEGYNPLMSR